MKEIVEFLKQKRNMKYSFWMIIFGLIFALNFLANQAQISQILEKPIRIVPGTKEARQYQVSGWQGVWAKGKKSILKVAFPRKKTYQMVIKAFSCSPPDTRDQRIEVYFNNIALDRLKFRKTSRWQEFRINIHPYLTKETNTIKFVYTQDTSLSLVAFDYLEFRNDTFRIKDLYLLFDFLVKRQINYSTFRILSHSFSFAFLLWFFWLLYSRFLFRLIGGPAGEAGLKMKFIRAARIDFWTYFPSVILFSLFALVSFFSSYHFVYSPKTFFVLALAPTVALKLLPYKELFLRFIKIIFKYVEKTYREVKKALSFLKKQSNTFRKFLIRYHKTNLSSAFILDFMLLFVLCAILLTIKAEWMARQLANLAYLLLVIGIVMEAVQFFREGKKGRKE